MTVKSLKILAKDHTQRSKIPNPIHRHLNFHRQEIEADQPTTTGFYDTNKHRCINRQIVAFVNHVQTFDPALELAGMVKAQISIYLIDVCDQDSFWEEGFMSVCGKDMHKDVESKGLGSFKHLGKAGKV